MALIILSVTAIVSLAGLWWAPAVIDRSLFRPYWLLPKRQYWSILGNALVHADMPHLLFNAFTFAAFAFRLEDRIGSARLLALYLCGILASDGGTWARYRANPGYASLGASGAILAVLFAALVYNPRQSVFILPIPVPIPAPVFAVGYLLYSYYLTRHPRGNVNHQAHFAGALAGLLFVGVTDPPAWQHALRALSQR